MAVSIKLIKRRIKSVANTKKITKAMELVAASKMKKAQNATLKTRSYSNKAWSLITDLSLKTEKNLHPLLVKSGPPVKKICVVLVTSDRGLCGGFNSQIIKKVLEFIKRETANGREADFITVGKKGRDMAARNRFNIVADFTDISSVVNLFEIKAISKIIIDDFINGKYDEIYLAYTDFVSTIIQKSKIIKLLPFEKNRDVELGKVTREEDVKENAKEYEFIFEPTPDKVLENMLPRLVEMQIYQAILESNASEHSARMVAMKNASDSAVEMIFDLTLTYNQARQSAITKEIMEIVGGKAALE
jgi:F-type H+-transporting ATPase subunit gamma